MCPPASRRRKTQTLNPRAVMLPNQVLSEQAGNSHKPKETESRFKTKKRKAAWPRKNQETFTVKLCV